jgi:hypothetical protein
MDKIDYYPWSDPFSFVHQNNAVANEVNALREQQEYQFYQQTTRPSSTENEDISSRIRKKVCTSDTESTSYELESARKEFDLMLKRQELFLECERLKRERFKLRHSPSQSIMETLCGLTVMQSFFFVLIIMASTFLSMMLMYFVFFK